MYFFSKVEGRSNEMKKAKLRDNNKTAEGADACIRKLKVSMTSSITF